RSRSAGLESTSRRGEASSMRPSIETAALSSTYGLVIRAPPYAMGRAPPRAASRGPASGPVVSPRGAARVRSTGSGRLRPVSGASYEGFLTTGDGCNTERTPDTRGAFRTGTTVHKVIDMASGLV